jgi:ATP-dependent Zn protease
VLQPPLVRRALLYGVVAVALAAALLAASASSRATTSHSYNGPPPSFTSDLAAGSVVSVVIDTGENIVQVTDRNGDTYSVNYPDTVQLTELLTKYPQVSVTSKAPSAQWWGQVLTVLVPIASILALLALVVSFLRLRRQRS